MSAEKATGKKKKPCSGKKHFFSHKKAGFVALGVGQWIKMTKEISKLAHPKSAASAKTENGPE